MSDYLFDYLSISKYKKSPIFWDFSSDSEGNRIHFTSEKALAVLLLTVRAFYFVNLFPRFLYRLHSASLHIMNGIIQFRKRISIASSMYKLFHAILSPVLMPYPSLFLFILSSNHKNNHAFVFQIRKKPVKTGFSSDSEGNRTRLQPLDFPVKSRDFNILH